MESFRGDGNASENPQNFIRHFQRDTMDLDDVTRCRTFPTYICASSVADDWYDDLESATKFNWEELEKAFEKRWPKIRQVKKTPQEYEDELMNTHLEETALAKKVDVGGSEVWSHVAWADKIYRIAANAGIESTSTYIGLIRKSLPDLIKEKVGTAQKDWTAFADAVRNVSIEHIKDGVERINKKKAEHEDIVRRLARLEVTQRTVQTSAQRPAVTQQTTTPTYVATPARNNAQYAYKTVTSQQPNAAGGRQSLTPEQRDVLRSLINTLPQHPDTTAGRAAWVAQVIKWEQDHGGSNARVIHTTPYPLKPGTAMVCSGECFRCGVHGHNGRQCPIPAGQGLDRRETVWRAMCSMALGSFNRDAAPMVNLVEVTSDGAWEEGTVVEGYEQGKE